MTKKNIEMEDDKPFGYWTAKTMGTYFKRTVTRRKKLPTCEVCITRTFAKPIEYESWCEKHKKEFDLFLTTGKHVL